MRRLRLICRFELTDSYAVALFVGMHDLNITREHSVQ